MRWKVMVSAPYMQPSIERFRPMFDEHGVEICLPNVNERLEEEELLSWVGDIDGAICGDDRFTERVLRAAPRLKVISKWGTGIDSIDRAACERLGIAVRNTPNAFSQPVADTVMGYILCFARGLPWLDRQMKAGEWQKLPGRSLRECTLGVIGVGNVGKAVVRRARAFGMTLLGNDLIALPGLFVEETGLRVVSLAELLFRADFVSINCDLNRTSYHLLSDDEFDLLKPGAVLINTARGAIVDEAAMVRALASGRLSGAALDVFEREPLPVDSPLRQMGNVMLSPHNANSSHDAWERVHETTCTNLLEELYRRST